MIALPINEYIDPEPIVKPAISGPRAECTRCGSRIEWVTPIMAYCRACNKIDARGHNPKPMSE